MTDFEILVADMRKAQKDYFRTRSQNALRSAKELEKQVDKHLKKAQKAEEDYDDDLFNLIEEQFDGDDIIGFRN